jgi:elongation factor 2
MLVSVEDGSVAFGCGKDQWAFTVPQFAQRFANVLKTDPSKLKLALWGEHYYNPETKTIVTNS